MLPETKRILLHRLVSILYLFIVFLIPLGLLIWYWVMSMLPPEITPVTVLNSDCYTDYYEYSDRTSCTVVLTCNTAYASGNATVAFYDENDKLLSMEKRKFSYSSYSSYCKNNRMIFSSFSIDGEVDSFEILDYDLTIEETNEDYSLIASLLGVWLATVLVVPFFWLIHYVFLISPWLFSYRTYDCSGTKILVYAGRYHNYIKVNGVKMDEHNTPLSFGAIRLSCTLDDGTVLQARINILNRISLKVNDRLCQPTK